MTQEGFLPLTHGGDIITFRVLLGHAAAATGLSLHSPVLAVLATTAVWLILRALSRHNAHQLSV